MPSGVDPSARLDLPSAELSQNARIVLAKRYLKKDESGNPVEDPEEMFWRVASVIASEDAKFGASEEEVGALAREFYLLMTRRLFEPNSPTLMNAGRPLGAALRLLRAPGGGLALERTFGDLRYPALHWPSSTSRAAAPGSASRDCAPAGDIVKSTTGVASGPGLLHEAVRRLHRGGEAGRHAARRQHGDPAGGPPRHPRVRRLQAGPHPGHQLQHLRGRHRRLHGGGREGGGVRPVQRRAAARVVGRLDARTVFDKIVRNAWATGEPGVYFIDRANSLQCRCRTWGPTRQPILASSGP